MTLPEYIREQTGAGEVDHGTWFFEHADCATVYIWHETDGLYLESAFDEPITPADARIIAKALAAAADWCEQNKEPKP